MTQHQKSTADQRMRLLADELVERRWRNKGRKPDRTQNRIDLLSEIWLSNRRFDQILTSLG